MNHNHWYSHSGNILTLTVYVQPGAKCTEIVGFHGEALKIRLASPPVDGQANQALLKFLAHLFKVPVKQVGLKRGGKSRHKVVVITGSLVDPCTVIMSEG